MDEIKKPDQSLGLKVESEGFEPSSKLLLFKINCSLIPTQKRMNRFRRAHHHRIPIVFLLESIHLVH